MEIKAESKYVRISPRKAQLVARAIKGLSLKEALESLSFIRKKAAKPIFKTLKSAIANATHNLKLKEENLRIRSIEILKGPVFKRWRPVSRGRAHPYLKRTSHIKVVLEEYQRSNVKNQNDKSKFKKNKI